MTLVKRHYLKKKPIWARMLKKVPENIWQGEIQTKLSRRVLLAADNTSVSGKTLYTQKQATEVEQEYRRILYTDASVLRV